MSNETKTSGPRILLVDEVLRDYARCCRASLYRWIRAGRFPQPVQLGSMRIGFIASEVEEWAQTRQLGVKRREAVPEEL